MRLDAIGFTGTQEGLTAGQMFRLTIVLRACRRRGAFIARHGICIGADEQFDRVARAFSFAMVAHPPEDEKKVMVGWTSEKWFEVCEPADYLGRNAEIAALSHLLIACPKGFEEEKRSGTWSTVRRARWCKTPRLLIWPDGTTKGERG
jgi:hypothetical protein